MKKIYFPILLFLLTTCQENQKFDVILKNCTIYDGSGQKPYRADIGVLNGKIEKIGDLKDQQSLKSIEVGGLAVSSGFINVLSWAYDGLLADGRSMSDLKQGVTLEVFGEGRSPVLPNSYQNPDLMAALQKLEKKGVSCNIASFFGATTARIAVLGYQDRQATASELEKMKKIVEKAMQDGALGIGSSLIYPPAFYASTQELIALCQVAAKYKGRYISHLRSEGNAFEKAVEELLRIAQNAQIPAEIYHLKAAGKQNWSKIDRILEKIDSANRAGLDIKTNMYNYTAASTGLEACLPPWTQEGGEKKWIERLKNPQIRQKIISEMNTPSSKWENFYLAADKPENILVVGVQEVSLQKFIGKNLAQIAQIKGKKADETILDLIAENGGDVQAVYFLMSEENIRKQIALPEMTFGSDAGSYSFDKTPPKSSTHPRAYGNFARLLEKYVQNEKIISLQEAIRRLTYLPAQRFGLKNRGQLKEGFWADIVVFDPQKIKEKATFEQPHQYAEGVLHVLVNGKITIRDGKHTGEKAGKIVRNAFVEK